MKLPRWTGTGSAATLPASISLHGQSTLPDGKVLVSGGSNGSTSVNMVYIYIPNTNAWIEAASLPASINAHGQSALNDGRVLISGGWIGSAQITSAYIYNHDSDIWNMVNPIPTAAGLGEHSQSTLNDGRVLVSGGWIDGVGSINSVYMYTPNNNKWESVASFPIRSCIHGQSTLFDGSIFTSGGSSYTHTYIYTPNSTGIGLWETKATLTSNVSRHGQSTLDDGRVLISGGVSGTTSGNGHINTVYIYTPTGTGSWANVAPMPTSICYHGQSTLADGRVFVSGGQNDSGKLNTAYIYTPAGWVAVGHSNLYCEAFSKNASTSSCFSTLKNVNGLSNDCLIISSP